MNIKVFVSTEVARQLNPLTLLPYLAYPDWLALKCVESKCNCSLSHAVFFCCCCCFLIYAWHLHNTTTANTSAAQKDRGVDSRCTRDFILISSWQSSQTAEFIISISLSPTHMHSRNVQTRCIDFICIKITLFCVAIVLSGLILTPFSDWTVFRTQLGHPGLFTHSPCFNLCSVLICVCKSSARWAVSSTELKDSLGSDSVSRVPEPASTRTVNSPVTGIARPFGSCGFQIGFPPRRDRKKNSDLIVIVHCSAMHIVDQAV